MIDPALKSLVATRPLYRVRGYVFVDGNDGWKDTNPEDDCDFILQESDFYIDGNSISVENVDAIIGNAISKTAKIRLKQSTEYSADDFIGACIVLIYTAYKPDGTSVVISGDYFFTTRVEQNGDALVVEALDIIKKTDVPYVMSLTGDYWTLREIYEDACQQADVLPAYAVTEHFQNDDFVVFDKPIGYTCRQIFGFIAMIACGNAIALAGFPGVKILSISGSSAENNLDQWISIEPTTDVIQITGIRTFQYRNLNGGEVYPPAEHRSIPYAEGYVFEFENPLVEGRYSAAIEKIQDIMRWQFINFRGTHVGYPIAELGDPAYITHAGGIFTTFLTSIHWDIAGATEFACAMPLRTDNDSSYQETSRAQIHQGGTGADNIADARANLGFMKSLATASGNGYAVGDTFDIPGADKYTLFLMRTKTTAGGTQVISIIGVKTSGGDTIAGVGGQALDNSNGNMRTAQVRMVKSGTQWNLTHCGYITHTAGGNHSASTTLNISEIIGIA